MSKRKNRERAMRGEFHRDGRIVGIDNIISEKYRKQGEAKENQQMATMRLFNLLTGRNK